MAHADPPRLQAAAPSFPATTPSVHAAAPVARAPALVPVCRDRDPADRGRQRVRLPPVDQAAGKRAAPGGRFKPRGAGAKEEAEREGAFPLPFLRLPPRPSPLPRLADRPAVR